MEAVGRATISFKSNDELMAHCFQKSMKTLPPEEAVSRVRRGLGLSTYIVQFLCSKHANETHRRYLKQLVDGGLVWALLDLLNRSDEGGIEDVIAPEDGSPPFHPGSNMPVLLCRGNVLLEGHVVKPLVWVDILRLMLVENQLGTRGRVSVEIAKGIGPLIQGLHEHDDMKREVFKEKGFWYDVYLPFVNLLYNLVETDETIPILIKHEGLLDMLVKSIFFEESRPDIMEEAKSYQSVLKHNNFAQIADYAAAVLERIMKSHELEDDYKFYYDGAGKECNVSIGITSIVNNAYNSGCDRPFILGMLDLLRSSKISAMKVGTFRPSLLNMINILVVSGCVDKEIIAGIVDFGSHNALSYDDADHFIKVVYESTIAFVPEKIMSPQDSKVAAAISAGFFEMILKFLTCFQCLSSKDKMIRHMGQALQGAQSVALCRSSSKALTLRRDSIIAALKTYDEKNVCVTSNDSTAQSMRKDIIQMIRTMVNRSAGGKETEPITTELCGQCLKMLSKDERKYCSKCNFACYCSKACQMEHWKAQHKLECKEFSKRSKSEVRKLEAERKNVSTLGNKILNEKRSQIVVDATLMGLDVVDCAVLIDLREVPSDVKLIPADEMRMAVTNPSTYDNLRARGAVLFLVIQRDMSNPFTQLSADGGSHQIKGKASPLYFRGYVSNLISWPMAQSKLKEHFCDKMDLLKEKPELGKQFLDDFMQRYLVESLCPMMTEHFKMNDPDLRNDPELLHNFLGGAAAELLSNVKNEPESSNGDI